MSNNAELANLFNKYNCDKASKHQYHTVYGPELEHLRNEPINILEVGVFKGASTRAWLDYFPNATIYGLDIFTRVDPKNIPVLDDPRVKWIRGDSTSLDIILKIRTEWPQVCFDVIIDDGLHTPRANANTLNNLIGLMKADGKYFIEDVWALSEMTSEELSNSWIQEHSQDLNILEEQYFLKALADKKSERYDLRYITKHPDSYIIKVTK
jgi:hypothetical protein